MCAGGWVVRRASPICDTLNSGIYFVSVTVMSLVLFFFFCLFALGRHGQDLVGGGRRETK